MSCACALEPKYQLKLIDIIKHGDETYSFDFKSPDVTHWEEGDSSKLYFDINGELIGKKFSYATLPNEAYIRFTTRIKEVRSVYKDYFAKLKVGDVVEVTAPKGNFKLKREGRPVVLVSNGVGIAAVSSLVKSFELDQNGIPNLTQINVDSTGAIYKDEFDRLMGSEKRFKSLYSAHRSEFYPLLDFEIQSLLKQYSVDPLVYVVGSEGFVNDLIQHLKSVGFEDQDIVTDGHAISGGSCGCSTSGGCGCGANLVTNILNFM